MNEEKSIIIANEIAEVVKGEKKIEESELLSDFFSESENLEQMTRRFNSADDAVAHIVSSRNKAKDVKRLENKLKSSMLKHRIAASIAVAASLTAVAVLLWNHEEKLQITTNQLESTTPILLLESGEKIVLDCTEEIKDKNFVADRNAIKYVGTDGTEQRNKLIVPAKYTYKLQLSDSTEVTLNAGSTIVYPTTFNGTTREVELIGEAYFKVKKSYLPFIVKVKDMSVKVYGTEFNIRAATGDATIETLLISGSVGVTIDGKDELRMTPSNLLSYNSETKKMSLQKDVIVNDYVLWKDGYFRYKEQSIQKILCDLSIWYGVKFKTNLDMLLTINLSKSTSEEDMIQFLEKIVDCKIIKKERGVYIIE